MKTKRARMVSTHTTSHSGVAVLGGRSRRCLSGHKSPGLKISVRKLISKMSTIKGSNSRMESIRNRLKDSGFPTSASSLRAALERCVKAGLLKKLRDDVFSIPAKTCSQKDGLPRGRRSKGLPPGIEGHQRRQPKATDSRSSADSEMDEQTTEPTKTKPETPSTVLQRWGSMM